jgi:plasmid stability protein
MSADTAPISQLMFRVPDALHERLESQAQANRRSLNAEVVARLEASFASHEETIGDEALVARIRRMEELVQESTTASDA